MYATLGSGSSRRALHYIGMKSCRFSSTPASFDPAPIWFTSRVNCDVRASQKSRTKQHPWIWMIPVRHGIRVDVDGRYMYYPW